MRNLALTIRERARTRGQHVAMRVKRDGAWREISYSRLDEEAGALAQGLVELGLAVGGTDQAVSTIENIVRLCGPSLTEQDNIPLYTL